MKKILIAGYPDLTKNYENAVASCGAIPITTLHVPDVSLYDGLLLPGGGDIDPKLFGQLNQGSRIIDAALDRLQLTILKSFVLEKKPILGICKGMQLLNIYFGGDIVQHLPSYRTHQYDDGDQVHPSFASHGSLLYKLYGKSFFVNSAHHQGADTPGAGIRYIQFAPDGVAESLCHEFLPIYGVQWHPERMCLTHKRSDCPDGALLFQAFLNSYL